MALGEKSFFWDKPAGTLTEDELAYYQYAAQDLASFFECLYTTGIAPQMAITSPDDNPEDYIGSSLAVTAGSGLQVVVSPGVAMIKGRGYIASLPVTLQVAAGKTTDIVLRMDLGSEKPEIYVAAKQRAANASLESNISHESLNYEVALATIVIPSDSTAITQSMITDQRLNTTVHPTDGKPIAGLMKSIPNADTKGIWEDYKELQAQYVTVFDRTNNNFVMTSDAQLQRFQTEFYNWFETAKSVISEDAAGRLLNLINGKADKSTTESATLRASSWTGTAVPYTYTLNISGVTATSNQDLIPGATITAEELEAYQEANLQDGGQSAGTITLKAWGEKPTVSIPVRVILRGDT
ncbi:hypothetical protein [Anaeromassilibacillus senegalensis]|uniref:hypothetical protein n=1 Tax=Anaeromassilibacillus senegalensis TaxID=1673717 RepID=UPI0006805BF2|nr:hypothetical protein [Anaeromassilibacillus senegalensis]